MSAPPLRLHAFLPASRANGPGVRAVVWTQGCSLGCPGCYNPLTHPHAGGDEVSADDLVARILALGDTIQGVTVSGGEPFQQRAGLLAFLQKQRRDTTLSVLVFTGFTWEEVQRLGESPELLACIDVLIAGRYDPQQHLATALRGSANKTVHFLTSRYSPADLADTPAAEIAIAPSGEVLATGIDPVQW